MNSGANLEMRAERVHFLQHPSEESFHELKACSVGLTFLGCRMKFRDAGLRLLKRINMWSRHSTPSYIYIQSESESCWVISNSLRPHGLYSPWNSPGQNTRVGSVSLLQGIFPTQGSNPGVSHCRQILYQPSHQGNLLYIQETWKNVATKKVYTNVHSSVTQVAKSRTNPNIQ